jgi:hypothetical protein
VKERWATYEVAVPCLPAAALVRLTTRLIRLNTELHDAVTLICGSGLTGNACWLNNLTHWSWTDSETVLFLQWLPINAAAVSNGDLMNLRNQFLWNGVTSNYQRWMWGSCYEAVSSQFSWHCSLTRREGLTYATNILILKTGSRLQTGRSLAQFPMSLLDFSINLILSVALWPWSLLSL